MQPTQIPTSRKPYNHPAIKVYGHIPAITAQTSNTTIATFDGHAGVFNKTH
jgi:hypothetical protein